MCSNVSRRLGILRRVKVNLSKETLSILYNAIVLPHFHYGVVIYGNCRALALKRLHVLQDTGGGTLLDCDD